MVRLKIQGGISLHGEVEISGAKNAALPIMAACLLTRERVQLHGVPRTTDVDMMVQVLQHLGMETNWVEAHTLVLRVVDDRGHTVPADCIEAMRASVCALGPLLARRGAGHLSKPGGCRIGARPIDAHLKGLRALGAKIVETDTTVTGSARELIGSEVDMSVPSGSTVLGTANVLSAAVLARGRTTIEHAAREPEICELAGFLNSMGAFIHGIGTGRLVIDGVRELHGTSFDIIPDRIETGTYLVAGAITGGDVLVRDAHPEHLGAVLQVLTSMGVELTEEAGGVRVRGNERFRRTDIVTESYPGFPTDMQAQVMALMCLAQGTSTVTERIFPERFKHVAELRRMGARIQSDGARVEITGVEDLAGVEVTASDLRASAALVLAGLAARGTTMVNEVEYIHRGYERIAEKLRGLGAAITEVA